MVNCQVCGHQTISERGSFDVCEVCFWEDDGVYDNPDEVEGGPNGDLSLTQARANYQKFGAIEERFIGDVRRPRSSEIPK